MHTILASTPTRKVFKGTIARLAIQCECPDTGIVGDFLFIGESHKTKDSRVSSVYSDLFYFFRSPEITQEWQEVAQGNAAMGFLKR